MNNQPPMDPDLFSEPPATVPAQSPAPATQPINMMSVASTATDLDTAVQNAEKFVELQSKIRQMAVKVTSIFDWIDEGGKPYLQEQGAQKIAMCFGISIQNVSCETDHNKDSKGDYIVYNYNGEAVWQGRVTPQLGTCSSRDKFFGRRKGELLPLTEVNLPDVRKKAYTNMLNRAIKSCLGLSYTWAEIETASENRITQQKIAESGNAVGFDKGSRGGNTRAPETQKEKDKKTDLWSMLVDLYGDESSAGDALEKATSFTNGEGKEITGKRDISKVSPKQVEYIYKTVKKAHDKATNP